MAWAGYAVTTVCWAGGDDGLSITHTVCGTVHEWSLGDYVDGGVPLDRYTQWRDNHVCPDAVKVDAPGDAVTLNQVYDRVRWVGAPPLEPDIDPADLPDALAVADSFRALVDQAQRRIDDFYTHTVVPAPLAGPAALEIPPHDPAVLTGSVSARLERAIMDARYGV